MRGQYLNNKANFGDFYTAMVTLYRMCTGESWNGIYHDCSITEHNSNCVQSEGNCGNPGFAFVYFYSFYMFSAMILLNVFVAVVLKNFEEQIAAANKELTIPMDAMLEYEKLWLQFCDNDGEFLKVTKLGPFLNLLTKPLGLLDSPKFGRDLEVFINELKIPQAAGRIHYIDLGTSLTLHVFGRNTSNIPKNNEFGKYLQNEMFRKFPKFKSFKKMQTDSWTQMTTLNGLEITKEITEQIADAEQDMDGEIVVVDEHHRDRVDEQQRRRLQIEKLKSADYHDEDGEDEEEETKIQKISAFEYRRDHFLSETQREHVLDMVIDEAHHPVNAIHDHLESEDMSFDGDADRKEEEGEREAMLDSQIPNSTTNS